MDRHANSEAGAGLDAPWERRALGGDSPPQRGLGGPPADQDLGPRHDLGTSEGGEANATAPSARGEAGDASDAGGASAFGEGAGAREVHAPPAGDAAALRGTRFEFGGRRPYSFPPPRVTYRPVQRPLPGIGTVALGKVARLVPYGAFVDFLGFRGLVHVSQLLPGQRVERVEDVVQEGSEVVVRVIAIDPERRHINLTLVPSAPGAVPVTAAPGVRVEPDAPAAAAPDAVVPRPGQEVPLPLTAAAVAPAAAAMPGPLPAGASPDVVVMPPVVASVKGRPAKAAPARGVAKAPPISPPISQHGARAVRREMSDPTHPMARLLAAAGASASGPPREERGEPGRTGGAPGGSPDWSPQEPPGSGAGNSGVPSPAARQVHVAEPEPEPAPDGPATLEALAARYAHRAGGPAGVRPGSTGEVAPRADEPGGRAGRRARERSRQERDKQAAILARLRTGQ